MQKIPVRKISDVPKEPTLSGSFTIRDISQLLAGKDMVQELHRHDFFYVLFLKKGRGTHEIDFNTYKIENQSIFFMRPGQVHQLTLKAGSTGYLIEFKNDFYNTNDKVSNDLLRKTSVINFRQVDAINFKKLNTVLDNIFQEYTDKQAGFQDAIKAYLNILLLELSRHRQSNKSHQINSNAYVQEQLDRLMQLLETHIYNEKQVSQYANRLNLSSYQLNAITHTALGKTCSAVINEHIILESKRYLLATTNQVNQIAYHLGYEDVSYFIRFFKKHTGYSPDAFRNNFK